MYRQQALNTLFAYLRANKKFAANRIVLFIILSCWFYAGFIALF